MRLQENITAFNKSTEDSIRKLAPTNIELILVVNEEYKSTTKGSMADNFWRQAVQISTMQHRHEQVIAAMMKDLMDGGH